MSNVLYIISSWASPSLLALRAIAHDAVYVEPLAFDAASMQKYIYNYSA